MKRIIGNQALQRIVIPTFQVHRRRSKKVPHPLSKADAPEQAGRSVAKRIVGVITVVLVMVFGFVQPAQAAPSVPRLIPSRLPAGFQVEMADDNTGPSSSPLWMTFFKSEANDKAVAIFADPMTAADQKDQKKNFIEKKLKQVTVKKSKGFLDTSGKMRLLYWFEKGRLMTGYAVGVDVKTQVAFANAVALTKQSGTSFTTRATPAGFVNVFNGLSASLRGSYSRIIYVNDPNDKHEHLIVEVTSIDRRYLDTYFLSPFVSNPVPVNVNGKSAYQYTTEDYTSIWWEEQPGLLVEVSAPNLTPEALLDVASSVVPSDETAWAELVKQAEALSSSGSGEATPTGGLVGAGMIDGDPWTAQLSSSPNCVAFAIGTATTDACVKSPNALGWSFMSVKAATSPAAKSIAVGVAAANVATVVAKLNGVEVGRSPVGTVSGQPLYRIFVLLLPANTPAGALTVTISGLDAAGNEVQPPVGPRA
jgi:hypothetical protein